MTGFWLRRAALLAACACAALLAACGSSTIESALKPSRFIAFGDGFSDVGQGGAKFTVNDGSVNIWAQQVAASYGLPLAPASAGGLGFAQGNARITLKPDAAGNSATLTVKEQVDAFLAANALGVNDVVLIQGGISDIVAEMAAVTAGSQGSAQMLAKLQQAGRDLGAQVRRLVAAGGKQVVVASAYNLGRSPWATAIAQNSLLSTASRNFNDALLVSLVDLGANVLYVDIEGQTNLVIATPGNSGLSNSTGIACNSVDPGNGIGIGTGEVNSALCTPSTIAAGVDYNKFVFADKLYFTPVVNRLVGVFAFERIRARW